MMTFQSKLNPAEVLELQRLYRDKGFSVRELSVIYRVSERTVYRKVANLKPIKLARLTPKQQVRVKKNAYKPCGTDAAYQRHRRNNEYPCDLCLAAHATKVKKYKPPPKLPKRCGTDAAYQRHLRKGEKACKRCKKAHSKATSKRKRKKKRDEST
jgi:hypothetical protein